MGIRHDRREFLKKTAAGAAALAISGCTQSWEIPPDAGTRVRQTATKPSTLVQIKGPDVPKDLGAAVARLLEPLGGMGAFVKPGQSVLLKPNMGFAQPVDYHATTSTALITAVAGMVLTAGAARVFVADHPVSDAADVIESMGLIKALSGLKVRVMPIDDDSPFVTRKLPMGRELKEVEYLKLALEADVHIALPIAKSHSSAGFTGALKGTMGLIRSRKSFHWLHDLHQAVADINTGIRPHLTIMDGLSVMTTDGPRGPGELVRCDALIASPDPVAVDAAGVRLAPLHGRKVKPKRIRHLMLAEQMGLGRIDPPADQVHQLSMA